MDKELIQSILLGMEGSEDISSADLDELISKYPYAQILYYRKLKNLIREGADPGDWLQKLSLRSADRTHLYNFVMAIENELTPESEIAKQDEKSPEEPVLTIDMSEAIEIEDVIGKDISNLSFEEELLEIDAIPILGDSSIELLAEEIQTNEYFEEKIIDNELESSGKLEKNRKDVSKSSFSKIPSFQSNNFISWLNTLKSISSDKEDNETAIELEADQKELDNAKEISQSEKKKPKKKKKKRQKKSKKEAKLNKTPKKDKQESEVTKSESKWTGSDQLDEEIYSESLAELLEQHGHIEKAIYMYDRLRLKFPQKSAYFAAKLEKLKRKKKE